MKYLNSIFLLFGIGFYDQAAAGYGALLSNGMFNNPSVVDRGFNADHSTKFKLLTPQNWRNPVNFNLSCIPRVHFNKDHKTLIVLHGFGGTDYMTDAFKEACFENGKHEVNLIGIDWTGAQDPFYVFSTLRVQHVGKAVAKLIGSAVLTNYIDLNNVELIGHSLGAHAAGYAGKHLESDYGLKLPLIVGLDPAGPLFKFHNNKLQRTDAEKVVAIHTNDDYGHLEPFGGVDIYLNGGKKQPGLNDQESHCFAAEFYKGLLNIEGPLEGHRYKSFDEVEIDKFPGTSARKFFYGHPFPEDGTMFYMDTYFTQKNALPELEKLDFSRNPPPSSFDEVWQCASCSIM